MQRIGKSIHEARGASYGARVYFRNTDKEGVEILGYSHKKNQKKVIDELLKTY